MAFFRLRQAGKGGAKALSLWSITEQTQGNMECICQINRAESFESRLTLTQDYKLTKELFFFV